MRDNIIRLSNQRGGLNPEAVDTLSLEFDSPLYNLEYQLRHPFGIYNVSLNNIFSSFENLLLELAFANKQDIQSNKSDTKWNEDLLHSLEKLLYALMEHMDDCENIIKCFFPPRDQVKSGNQLQKLPIVSKFLQNTYWKSCKSLKA